MLTAYFLGKFQIVDGEKVLTEQSIRSEMLMKLILYFIIHRDHALTIQELSAALWEEDEIDNPTGALKNLMYRLRTTMKEIFGTDAFFVTGRGTYSWNSEIEIDVDVELFEDCVKKATQSDCSRAQKKRRLLEAIDLYKGEFGVKCKDVYWVMTQATYYHSLYLSVVLQLAEMLIEDEEYHQLEEMCGDALQYDVADENLHCYFVKALILQNKLELARVHLEEAEHILQETLGIRNSRPLEKLRKELMKLMKNDLLSIKEVLHEATQEEDYSGAFQCSFGVFKEIYRLESRKIDRLGMAEHIGLITINNPVKEQTQHFFARQAMDRLELITKNSLRSGDAYTRLNDIQLLTLLPGCSYESAKRVLERICNLFYEKYTNTGIEFKTDIREIEEYHPKKKE